MALATESVLASFQPVIQRWFQGRFGAASPAQCLGWPAIQSGRNALIAAPTGSGKTLAAFLVCIDRLVDQLGRQALDARPRVVYVSPLKALSNDIHRNLQEPLREIGELAGLPAGGQSWIHAAVRTGDTPPQERQRMLRRPPQILVTTPESLYLLISSARWRDLLADVDTVIVDEIHALARDKRGSHLALTLARLDALVARPPQRIGLSATMRPMDEMARYLVGTPHVGDDGAADCHLVDVGHSRPLDLAIQVPATDLEAVCSMEHWEQVYRQLLELIEQHRSTLIFVNTRRLAERIAHRLTAVLGPAGVASHHGSLSRPLRLDAEQRLKRGELKAIVATASLEMGIDVGAIDLVCQIGSPRAIATFLQRVGRSGHAMGATPRGRLFPLTRDELLECLALTRGVRAGRLEAMTIPAGPLDILAQQIVAEVASREWDPADLFALCRSAWPYRQLAREDFDAVVGILSDGITPTNRRGRLLHHDRLHGRLRARRGARLSAVTSAGAIPETGQFRVVTTEDETCVGDVDEDFAVESSCGDIFLLGNNSWQIVNVREGRVLVRDAHGAPPTVPFWFGEAPGRTAELSAELSQLRQDIRDRLAHRARQPSAKGQDNPWKGSEPASQDLQWLAEACCCSVDASRQALQYVAAQYEAIGLVPTARQIVFERFFDESGGMQLVIHAPLGSRINRAWGYALRKRFCRSFDFELQAAATDDGIVLSIGPQHSFPIESLFHMVHPGNARYLLEQAVLAVPMFQVRWRWNVSRALIVPRFQAGKKVPFYLQRYRSDDLLAAVFPETVGCLENHEGDITIPDHPLVQQTMRDCLHEAMDLDGWLEVLRGIGRDDIQLTARDTREPSPFSHQLLNANPYAFLDGAGLEERRTRAITTRKGLPLDQLRDLARLDPKAIDRVVRDAAPSLRNADELQEWLHEAVVVLSAGAADTNSWFPLIEPSDQLLAQLMVSQRTFQFPLPNLRTGWAATERMPLVRALFPNIPIPPDLKLPKELDQQPSPADALRELLRGWLGRSGPVTAPGLAGALGLPLDQVTAALEALEGSGTVLRGHYRPDVSEDASQWCDRTLLARIHRLTLDGLRKQVEPVSRETLVQFWLQHHRVSGTDRWGGSAAVREVVQSLQGIEIPAAAWESHILPARIGDYDPQWLDQLFATGELMWGRLRPPRRPAENLSAMIPDGRQRDDSVAPHRDGITGRDAELVSTDQPAEETVGRRGTSSIRLHRSIPISLLLREDLHWLLPSVPRLAIDALRSNARQVYETLAEHGALFWQQLHTHTGLLNAQLEEALRELAAAGLVTCDSFESVRQLIARPSHRRRSGSRRLPSVPGRWSLFPGTTAAPNEEVRLAKWCQQLLRRWGVVFRDLLARDPSAPHWADLARLFRRLEYQGEVRGGRFVRGVAGVQFATSQAVAALRQLREAPEDRSWLAISAADPLNSVGVLDPAVDRIPATTHNSLIFQQGACIGWKVGAEFYVPPAVPLEDAQAMMRALRLGRHAPAGLRVAEPRGG